MLKFANPLLITFDWAAVGNRLLLVSGLLVSGLLVSGLLVSGLLDSGLFAG